MEKLLKLIGKRGSILLLFLLLSFSANGQTKTNLELFFQLADSSANELANVIGSDKNVQIDFVLGKDYQVFQNTILAHFQNKQVSNEKENSSVHFSVTEVKVEYNEPERKHLFGSFVVQRNLSLSGNYSIVSVTNVVKDFHFSISDEIPYEDITAVENSSFPFTQGKIPAEPFFSSLLEPAIALGSAAVAVYIFFSARSK